MKNNGNHKKALIISSAILGTGVIAGLIVWKIRKSQNPVLDASNSTYTDNNNWKTKNDYVAWPLKAGDVGNAYGQGDVIKIIQGILSVTPTGTMDAATITALQAKYGNPQVTKELYYTVIIPAYNAGTKGINGVYFI